MDVVLVLNLEISCVKKINLRCFSWTNTEGKMIENYLLWIFHMTHFTDGHNDVWDRANNFEPASCHFMEKTCRVYFPHRINKDIIWTKKSQLKRSSNCGSFEANITDYINKNKQNQTSRQLKCLYASSSND